jgi:hypothetical protein
MTRASVIHVVTGLEIGGAEVRLFELCREEIRAEREVAVAPPYFSGSDALSLSADWH